jgi:hypothetical protein
MRGGQKAVLMWKGMKRLVQEGKQLPDRRVGHLATVETSTTSTTMATITGTRRRRRRRTGISTSTRRKRRNTSE